MNTYGNVLIFGTGYSRIIGHVTRPMSAGYKQGTRTLMILSVLVPVQYMNQKSVSVQIRVVKIIK